MAARSFSKAVNVNDFPYERLEHEGTIRVLVVHPAQQSSAPLLCSLEHHSGVISSEISYQQSGYIAVSYAWGEPVFSKEIVLNGKPFAVTVTVDEMLRDLRKPHKARRLWIDAICLAQADDEEKQQQIPRMSSIYAQARKVVIWLGGSTGCSKDHVMALLQGLRHPNSPPPAEDEIGMINGLLCHPWWTRRFTLQEAVANPCTYVRYRGTTLQWNALRISIEAAIDRNYVAARTLRFSPPPDDTCQIGQYNKDSTNLFSQDDSTPNDSAVYRLNLDWTKHPGDMLDALWLFHDTDCADPRDRISALRGLVSGKLLKDKMGPGWTCCPACKKDFPARYDIDWRQTFKEFALFCLKHGRSVELTHHLLAFGSLSRAESSSPTWVPDWSLSRSLKPKEDNALPDPGTISYLQDFPAIRTRLIFGSAPMLNVVQRAQNDSSCGKVAHLFAPRGSFVGTASNVLKALSSLIQTVRTIVPGHMREHKASEIIRAVLWLRCADNTWEWYNVYPLVYAATVLKNQLIAWQCKNAPNHEPYRQYSQGRYRTVVRTEGARAGWELDISRQALFNDVILPLLHKRLQSWYFFVAEDGSLGGTPAKPKIADLVVLRIEDDAQVMTFLMRRLPPSEQIHQRKYVAYAPCIAVRPEGSKWPNIKMRYNRQTITVYKKGLEDFQEKWLADHPWRK